MTGNDALLTEELLDRVLDRLGLDSRPRADIGGLTDVYAAWSRAVPFDNIRKLLHLQAGDPRPLAGDSVVEFLEAWLAWGTGGTCWAGNGALCMLLRSLGFAAGRGVGTMLVAPDLPPNHGTVLVPVDHRRYLVDASMLFGEPLLLDEAVETSVDHPSRGVRCAMQDGNWHVTWRPLHMEDGVDCRLEHFGATAAEFSERHERTRGWSPFNYALNVRCNHGASVVGIAFAQRVEIDAGGRMTQAPLGDGEERRAWMEELGIHPDIAVLVPADAPTPPPPSSRTASR